MPRKKKVPPIVQPVRSRTRSRKKTVVKTTISAKDGDIGKLVGQLRSLMRTAGIDKLSLWSSNIDVTIAGIR